MKTLIICGDYPFHTNKQDQIDYFFTTLENHLLKYNYIL